MSKLEKMRIKKRLSTGFIMVVAIASIGALIGCIAMIVLGNQYSYALKNYGFSQGDIGKSMTVFADSRSYLRAAVSYTDPVVIDNSVAGYKEKKDSFATYIGTVSNTLTADDEKSIYSTMSTKLVQYWNVADELIKLGATTDAEISMQAQARAESELTPLYDEIYSLMEQLMSLNVQRGGELEDQLQRMNVLLIILIVFMAVAAIFISTKLGNRIAKSIAEPMAALSQRLKTFAQGDLNTPFPKTETEDEVADMVAEAGAMAENLSVIIKDAGDLLSEMASGNYAVNSKAEDKYVGEFNKLLSAMQAMNRQMDTTLRHIDEAAKQVSAGSTNLADAAQALAEGATDQAGAVEELQATITNISSNVQATSKNLDESYRQAQHYAEEADHSKIAMHDMVQGMGRISDASKKIETIISQIEDIASQTNLLSLNASIEAARAGEAGRGFAVVADQIGKLASESAQSAVNTRQLIEGALQEIASGSEAAERVASSIEEVVKGVKIIADTAKELSASADQQAIAMGQAEQGVNQISEVVQSNSATAEETSATSEELSAQSISMTELVGQFTLRDK